VKRAWIALAVAGFFSAGVLFMMYATNRPEYREVNRARRPGSNESAVTYEINPGPTVGFAYAVHLMTNREASARKRGPEMWNSYQVEPSRVVWAGRDTLEVFVDNNRGSRWSIHEHGKQGVRVRTVWVEPGDSTNTP
jgi:hypothetical protein